MLKVSRAGLRARAVAGRRPARIDEVLAERLRQLIALHPTYGYRRLWALLRFGAGVRINRNARAVVTVSEYPDRDFVGSVTRHPQVLDQNTRTMLVEVDLPNNDLALLPGMYATVKITIHGSKQSPKVPDQALIFNNDDTFVPVVHNNRIHLVKVTLGLDDGTDCEVTRGLSGDETVALGLGQAAQEGELVQPVSAKRN